MSQAGAPGAAGDGLYVRRNLTPESAASLIAWAKEQGFTNLVPEHELHATVVYSRAPVWLRPRGGRVCGREIHEPLNEHWAEEKGFVKVEASALSVLPTLEAMALDLPSTPG